MPIVFKGQTTCAISGKSIEGKDVIRFPSFVGDPHDPAFVCSDACVIRSEFEKWELKGHATEKLREFWSLSPYFCAKGSGFYSLTQTDSISNRQF